jgi:hypothetical protein
LKSQKQRSMIYTVAQIQQLNVFDAVLFSVLSLKKESKYPK